MLYLLRQKITKGLLPVLASLALVVSVVARAEVGHPRLVVTKSDVLEMRKAIKHDGLFKNAFLKTKNSVDTQMEEGIVVPFPKDGGGGYTHEKHKSNYRLMYNAGLMYQLTGEQKYLQFVRDMLVEYAEMYPKLGVHPAAHSYSPGRLFWQSLNESVWLVYTSQAYDFIVEGLNASDKKLIEEQLLTRVANFLSDESPESFDSIHNHGTWATAAVGMTGFVLDKPEWVEKSLLGLDLSGTGGFLRQMDELFSPDGYYNEGPYYQRYAMMPFELFAKSIEVNRPEMKIFEKRNGILLKAINTTIQLSYNGLFFPINDSIKSKGIDTIELVYGVTIAYGLTGYTGYLDIAKAQDNILLTGDGLKVAHDIDAGKTTEYDFGSEVLRDGRDGDRGALVIMRDGNGFDGSTVVFKPTSQGMGQADFKNTDWSTFDPTKNHGHFDKLNWLFYDNGNEIVVDYGSARFLNVVSKNGGHYLHENETYAKQTVAHNTLVVDQTSNFNDDLNLASSSYPTLNFYAADDTVKISSATMDTAYKGVSYTRTIAMLKLDGADHPIVLDHMAVQSDKNHKLDMPLHYSGDLVNLNFDTKSKKTLKPLGKKDGYQHLWLKAEGKPKPGLMSLTWLNSNRFYTLTSVTDGDLDVLFTELGANDPNFNLLPEHSFIIRKPKAKQFDFVSVLESHGDYNPAMEYTLKSEGDLSDLKFEQVGNVSVVELTFKSGQDYVLAYTKSNSSELHSFSYKGETRKFNGNFKLFTVK